MIEESIPLLAIIGVLLTLVFISWFY